MKALWIFTLSVILANVTLHHEALASDNYRDLPGPARLAGRKTVTVSANNAAEAIALANRKHPGWTAIKVKKTGSGRFWQVTMVTS
jgi:hypothetical protein